MSLSNTYGTDSQREAQGVNMLLGTNDANGKPMYIKLAHQYRTNREYAKSLESESKPYRREMDLGVLQEGIAEKIFRDVFARTIIKGWDNIPASDLRDDAASDELLPFTTANAVALLEKYPKLHDQCVEFATKADNYKKARVEAEEKN